MPKKGNAYLDGTVHVGKEVQTIQRYKLELYMWEKRYKPVTGTVHVGKCFPVSDNLLKFLIRGGGIFEQIRQGFLFFPLTGQWANAF